MRVSTGARLVLSSLIALVVLGCGSQEPPLAPLDPVVVRGGTAGTGGARIDPSLVGTWRRTLLFTDDIGAALSAETIWTFRSDGGARRDIITRNFTTGISDRTVTLAGWVTEGDVLVITFTGFDQGTIRLPYRIVGGVLILGGQEFFRE
jgi:hypothetical protein